MTDLEIRFNVDVAGPQANSWPYSMPLSTGKRRRVFSHGSAGTL